MRLRKPVAAHILLVISLMSSLGFLGTYPSLHVSDLGEVCTLSLFAWLALSTKINSKWLLYVFLPAFLLPVSMVFYAYIFASRLGSPLLPSVLAQRYYVYVLIGPVVYMLHVRGWRLADFSRVFISAIFLTLMSRVVSDIASPHSLLLSGSVGTLRLNAVYGENAYLLRRMDTTSLFSAFYFGMGLFRARSLSSAAVRAVITVLAVVLLAITVPRTLIAAAVVALILYVVFLARPMRTKLLVILLPMYVVVVWLTLPQAGGLFVHLFSHDLSYTVRAESAQKAWQAFLEHPFFGMGSDSVRTVSFQEIFGSQFYPSDVGLLGVAFQYGLVGVVSYFFFSVWLFVNLLRLLWDGFRKVSMEERTFLWALFMMCLLIIVASPLQAKFIYGDGLPLAAFSWGLLMAYKHDLSARVTGRPVGEIPDQRTRPIAGARSS